MNINAKPGLRAGKVTTGRSLDELTAMANISHPYRLDTPANHRVAMWSLSLSLGSSLLTGAFTSEECITLLCPRLPSLVS
jgi:hypothetical protein